MVADWGNEAEHTLYTTEAIGLAVVLGEGLVHPAHMSENRCAFPVTGVQGNKGRIIVDGRQCGVFNKISYNESDFQAEGFEKNSLLST